MEVENGASKRCFSCFIVNIRALAALVRPCEGVVNKMIRTPLLILGAFSLFLALSKAATPAPGTYAFVPPDGEFVSWTSRISSGSLTVTSGGAFTGKLRPLVPHFADPPGPAFLQYTPFIYFRGAFDENGIATVVLPPPENGQLNPDLPFGRPYTATHLTLRF